MTGSVENGATAPDPIQVREHAQAIQRRIGETVVIGVAVYAGVCAIVALMNWEMSWSSGIRPWRVGITMSFTDAAAILGVLGGLVVAVNIIVWGWHTTGRSDPRVYAHAQTMARVALAVGQASVFVGIALVLSYAAVEFDVPRLTSGVIAVGVIVMISVHTAEGLNDGSNLERQVYREGMRADAARLGRVVRRWHVVSGNENQLTRFILRDVGICAVWVAAPVMAGLIILGENGRRVQGVMLNCGIVLIVALALTIVAFITVVIPVRAFVVKDVLNFWIWVVATTVACLSYLLSALVISFRQEIASWPIIFSVAFWLLLGPLAFVLTSLRSTRDRWFLGNSARLIVRRSIRRLRARKLRILRTPIVDAPAREGWWQRTVDWYEAATGSRDPQLGGGTD
jgi:hypothetical protein